MSFIRSMACLLAAAAMTGHAKANEDGYNEFTIRVSDIPANAPRFDDYGVEVFAGSRAPPDLKSHRLSRLYRTRLAEAAKQPINFAGHFVVASWGCGTNCSTLAIIDTKTGKVFHPNRFTFTDATNVHPALIDESSNWPHDGALKFRQDSALLVLIGSPEERTEERGIYFLRWRHDRLETIRFIKRAWYP